MNLSIQPRLLSAALLSLLSSPTFSAQDLDQVIVSATRVEQAKSDYTGNVIVITSEQLVEKAIQTLPEALDRIAGIPMYSNGGLGTTTEVYLRGHDSKRILLLVDGMRFNDSTGLSGPNWQHLLVGDIDRIEIIEGAQAGIWGSDAASGVINVITKKAATGTHGAISYTLSTLGQKQTQGSVGYADKTFDARIGYTSLTSDEFSSVTPIFNGSKQDPLTYEKDGYRNNSVDTKFGVNLNNKHRLELNALKVESNGAFDGSPYGTTTNSQAANLGNINNYHQQTVGANYLFDLADWKVKINAQTGDIERNFIYTTGSVSSYKANTNQQGIIANRGDALGSWTFGLDSLQQQAGAMGTTKTSGSYGQQAQYASRTQKFYLPQSSLPTILNLSLRNDDFNEYKSYLGKRYGIKQMLSQEGYFAINMADSRRTPTLFERYYDGNTSVRADVGTLTPETVNSKEMSIGYQGYSLTRFEDTVSDLIQYSSSTKNYANISGNSLLQGWEWKINQQLPSINTELSINYLVLDAKDATGKTLARRPDSSGSIGWTYLGLNKAVLGIQSQFVGTRLDYNTTPTATQLNPDTGNYWLWHANISYQWNKEVRLFAKGINLTDERIIQGYANNSTDNNYAAYYAYTPRTFVTGVEYKF